MKQPSKKVDKKYAKSERKIEKAKSKSPEKGAKEEAKRGYNYKGAKAAGLAPDSTGHWPSRNPHTGEILKGRKHPTIGLTKKAERDAGYKVTKKDGVLYSQPKKKSK